MELPKFLMCDNTDLEDDIFIFHTEYPRFIMDVASGEVEVLDDTEDEDEKEFDVELQRLIAEGEAFYDREAKRYEEGM